MLLPVAVALVAVMTAGACSAPGSTAFVPTYSVEGKPIRGYVSRDVCFQSSDSGIGYYLVLFPSAAYVARWWGSGANDRFVWEVSSPGIYHFTFQVFYNPTGAILFTLNYVYVPITDREMFLLTQDPSRGSGGCPSPHILPNPNDLPTG